MRPLASRNSTGNCTVENRRTLKTTIGSVELNYGSVLRRSGRVFNEAGLDDRRPIERAAAGAEDVGRLDRVECAAPDRDWHGGRADLTEREIAERRAPEDQL